MLQSKMGCKCHSMFQQTETLFQAQFNFLNKENYLIQALKHTPRTTSITCQKQFDYIQQLSFISTHFEETVLNSHCFHHSTFVRDQAEFEQSLANEGERER